MTSRGTVAARRAWPLGLVVALIMGVLAASPAMAAPAAPGNLAPKSTTVKANPVFKWSRVRGAVSYNVQVSTSSSFSTLLYSTGTTNRQVTPTAQLPTGQDLVARSGSEFFLARLGAGQLLPSSEAVPPAQV